MILSKKTRNCHELWYNERMKYPKIDLKTIRLQTRQFQAENPHLFLVYLLPSMLVILSGFLNPLARLQESVLEQSFFSMLAQVLQAYLFPLVVSFCEHDFPSRCCLCDTPTPQGS